MRTRHAIFALALTGMTAVTAVSFANDAPASRTQAPADSPTHSIRGAFRRLVALVEDRALPRQQRDDAIRRIVATMFDFRSLAARALSGRQESLASEQRTAFAMKLEQLTAEAVIGAFTRHSAARTLRFIERFQYGGEAIEGRTAVVHMILEAPPTPVPLDLHLLGDGEAWRIIDVSVRGLGLADSYRAQVDHVLRTKSFSDLTELMDQNRALLEAARLNRRAAIRVAGAPASVGAPSSAVALEDVSAP